jgi:hypothetical protein
MIKTLRTSGGDFTTFDDWLTYLHGAYTIIPMAADEELHVEAGASFALPNTCNVVNHDANTVLTGDFKIIIKTDPTDDADTDGPAFLDAGNAFTGMTFKTNDVLGNLPVEIGIGFSISKTSLGGTNNFFNVGSSGVTKVATIKAFNSFLLFRGVNADWSNIIFLVENAGSAKASLVSFYNNLLLFWNMTLGSGNSLVGYLKAASSGAINFRNNSIQSFVDQGSGYNDFPIHGEATGGTYNVKNNTYEASSGGGANIAFYLNGGSPTVESGNLSAALGYATQHVQALTDSLATVKGRIFAGSAKLVGTETNLLDNGDNTLAPPDDYIGTLRPQNVTVDRGPFELGGSNTPPEIEIDSILVVA